MKESDESVLLSSEFLHTAASFNPADSDFKALVDARLAVEPQVLASRLEKGYTVTSGTSLDPLFSK